MVPEHGSTTTAGVAEVGEITLGLCDSCRFPRLVVQCTVAQRIPLLLLSVFGISLNLSELCLLTYQLQVQKGIAGCLALDVI